MKPPIVVVNRRIAKLYSRQRAPIMHTANIPAILAANVPSQSRPNLFGD